MLAIQKGKANKMTHKEHKQYHKKLHECLDTVVAHFIDSTGKSISNTPIIELLYWSASQMRKPDKIRRQDE